MVHGLINVFSAPPLLATTRSIAAPMPSSGAVCVMIGSVSISAWASMLIVRGYWNGYQSENLIVLSWIRLVDIGTRTASCGPVTPM